MAEKKMRRLKGADKGIVGRKVVKMADKVMGVGKKRTAKAKAAPKAKAGGAQQRLKKATKTGGITGPMQRREAARRKIMKEM